VAAPGEAPDLRPRTDVGQQKLALVGAVGARPAEQQAGRQGIEQDRGRRSRWKHAGDPLRDLDPASGCIGPPSRAAAGPPARPGAGRPAVAAAPEAATPWTNARRSRRAITGSRLEGVRVAVNPPPP